jgi:predicted metallopeptidase
VRFVNNGFGMELESEKFNRLSGEEEVIIESTKAYLKGSKRT